MGNIYTTESKSIHTPLDEHYGQTLNSHLYSYYLYNNHLSFTVRIPTDKKLIFILSIDYTELHMILVSILIIALFVMEQILFYKSVDKRDLTTKQKAYILTIKSAFIMTILSLYFNYKLYQAQWDADTYLKNLSKSEETLLYYFVLYMTSCMITDSIVGCFEYPQHMKALSGYIHHIGYIIVNIVGLTYNVYPLYLLALIEEIPTLLLGIGNFDKQYRNDMTFGVSFFALRIVYHAFLMYFARQSIIILFFSSLAFCLHVYWFYQWMLKYSPLAKQKNIKEKQV